MTRTLGAAVGAVVVILFLGVVASRISTPVSGAQMSASAAPHR